jgi:hypothetical protein
MKFPDWFKLIWWIVLLVLTGVVIFLRGTAISIEKLEPIDGYLLIIFLALALVPIFSEIDVWGIKLKREIDDLKSDLKVKISNINNEIRNSQIQTINQTIHTYGPPPTDNQLRELEIDITRIFNAKLTEQKLKTGNNLKSRVDVSEDIVNLFKVRYNIEKQLRRVWVHRFELSESGRHQENQPLIKIIKELTLFEIIDNDFYNILREILSICNYAIHGERVTDNQVKFVINNAKQVIDYLGVIK